MPLNQNEVFPVMQKDQWWAQKGTLALLHVLSVDYYYTCADSYFELEVWAPNEPPGNKWNWAQGLGPPKQSLLWFRSRLDVKHPVESYKTGTVYISARNHQLFFVANIEGGVWILADWEVTLEDLRQSYVFQPAPVDPNQILETRLERVLGEDHAPTESHSNLPLV
jgi:hypothetical protein